MKFLSAIGRTGNQSKKSPSNPTKPKLQIKSATAALIAATFCSIFFSGSAHATQWNNWKHWCKKHEHGHHHHKKKPTLTIKKVADGANGTSFRFAFKKHTSHHHNRKHGSSYWQSTALTVRSSGQATSGKFKISAHGDVIVKEKNIPDGWRLKRVRCTNGSRHVTSSTAFVRIKSYMIKHGDNWTCTFTNVKKKTTPKTAKLTFTKKAIGGNDRFTFKYESSGDNGGVKTVNISTQNGEGTSSVQTIPANADLTLREDNIPDGWNFKSGLCSSKQGDLGFSNPGPITIPGDYIKHGDNIVCSFENEKQPTDPGTAKLKFVKSAQQGDGTFKFSYDVEGDNQDVKQVSITTSGGNGTIDAVDIPSGQDVTVKEIDIPDNWNFQNATCSAPGRTPISTDSSTTINIPGSSIQDGDVWVCQYYNRTTPTTPVDPKLRFVKLTKDGSGDGTFNFTYELLGSNQSPTPVSLTTTNGIADSDFVEVPIATAIKVSETVPDGWKLTKIRCGDSISGNFIETQTDTNLTIPASSIVNGSKWTCTFRNQRNTGKLVVTKQTTGGNDDFDFTIDGSNLNAPLNFQLADGDEFATGTLVAGTYTITEKNLPQGWALEDISCDGQTTPIQNGVSVVIENETVSCTFQNTLKTGKLVVTKVTTGGNDDFDFTLDGAGLVDPINFQLAGGDEFTSGQLAVGIYTVTEKNLPQGWSLKSASCTGSTTSQTTNGVSIDLSEGTTTCTFRNFKETDEKMEDITKLYVHRRLDNLLTHDPDRSRIQRRLDRQYTKSYKPLKYSDTEGTAASTGSLSMASRDQDLFGNDAGTNGLTSRTSSGSFGKTTGALPFALTGEANNNARSAKFSISLADVRNAMNKKEMEKIQSTGLLYSQNPNLSPMGNLEEKRLDIWLEGHASRYDDGLGGYTRKGDFHLLYLGADYALTNKILFGALAQFDWTDEKVSGNDTSGNVEGHGWMVGPYVGVKISDNILFNARAAWGRSDNKISLSDELSSYRSGDFDTERWLVTSELSGNWYRLMKQGVFRFTPSIKLAHGNEQQEAYTNSLGQKISANDISLTRLSFGPEIGYRYQTENGGTVEPHIAVEGIWNIDTDNLKLSDGEKVGDEGLRGRVEGGVIIETPHGVNLRLVGEYDGIGEEEFESYGGQLWLNVPLQ